MKASRVQSAFADYQAASAAGDLRATRNALLKLVAAEEDVPDYWMELGKVQVGLGAFSDAYYAFSRALELDRDNPEVLSMLTQLALRGGDLDRAEDYAGQLELLSPGDTAVAMTYGIIALRRGDLKGASERAQRILAKQPNSSDAKILQSQVLLQSGRADEAIALLSEQARTRPNDGTILRALANLYERTGDTRRVAETRKRIWYLDRSNTGATLQFVEAAFRAGDITGARAASLSVMQPDAAPETVRAALELWRQYWPAAARVDEARRLASSASREQRPVYAIFFNTVGSPLDALPLVAADARLPVSAANLAPNTIMAMSLVLTGKVGAARQRLEEILLLDPENAEALRARAKLRMVQKDYLGAANDARKVVSLLPGSARDRILLAQTYQEGGDARNARRVLWDAFRDLAANQEVYDALRNFLARSGDGEAMHKLDREFADERQAKFMKEIA